MKLPMSRVPMEAVYKVQNTQQIESNIILHVEEDEEDEVEMDHHFEAALEDHSVVS